MRTPTRAMLAAAARLTAPAIFLAIPVATGFGPQLHAAELFWDGNGSSPQNGGAGTWNTTANRFSTTSGGTVNVTWNNANADSATFNGTAATVNLAGPITVNTITTSVAGYSIGNGNGVSTAANSLVFSGPNAGINTAHTSGTTTLTAFLNNQTLTKTGAGRLELNNLANTGTNRYVLKDGALTAPAPSRFGAPVSLAQNFFTFDGGGLGVNNAGNFDLGANRGFTILAGGAFLGATGLGITATIGAPIVGTSGGDLTVTGGGVFTGSGHNAGGVWVLTNLNNSWDGDAVVETGILKAGTSGVIPDTAVVRLAGGTFDASAVVETVKSIAGATGTVALGAHGKLTLANPAGETYSSAITASSGAQITKNGTGALTLAGSNADFQGEFILNSGTLGVGHAEAFGTAGTATLTLNGGALANNSPTDRTIPAAVTVTLGGDFRVDASLHATPGTIVLSGPTTITNSNRSIDVATGAALTLDGPVGQDVAGRSLTKTGAGTLTLTAANTYTGGTTVSEGTLVANNGSNGKAAGTGLLKVDAVSILTTTTGGTVGSVHVTSNATISAAPGVLLTVDGDATIDGTVIGNVHVTGNSTVGGMLAPGNSPGTYSVDGDLTLSPSSITQIELAGILPSEHDRVISGGLLTFAGTLNVSILAPFAPSIGDVFDIFDFQSAVGAFTHINLPTLTAGVWDTSALYTTGQLRVATPAGPAVDPVVPLPASAWMGLGLLGPIAVARRIRRAKS